MLRRDFLRGALSLFAAPAIVKFDSLMPVKVMPEEELLAQCFERFSYGYIDARIGLAYAITKRQIDDNLYKAFGVFPTS